MQELLYQTIIIALEAGESAKALQQDSSNFRLKADSSPITQADICSHTIITQNLKRISQYHICSEEAIIAYDERKDLEYYWLIDPLDGTKDFIDKGTGWSVNIALIYNNKPILGVVYAPCEYKLYAGLEGFGAFGYEANAIQAKIQSNMPNAKWLESHKLLLTGERRATQEGIIACDSVYHSSKQTQDFIARYNCMTLKLGSSLKICALAEGIADIYPRFNGTKEWDTAASQIILQEAGGTILSTKTKSPLFYNKQNLANDYFIAFAKSQIHKAIYTDFIHGGF